MDMRQQPKGRLTVDTSGWTRWAKLRDGLPVAMPVSATFTPEDDSHPTITVTVDEHEGRLVTTDVRLSGTLEHPIGTDAVRAYSVPKLTQIAAKQVAMPAAGWRDDEEPWPPSNEAVMESVVTATRARTTVDDGRLAEVADLYKLGGVTAVKEGLHISRAQAYRLRKQAIEAGYIEET